MPSSVGRGGWVFFREFVRAPLRTASIVPSSRALAVAMVPPLPGAAGDGCWPVVVELGPGTGAFTQVIGQIAPTGTRHLCVELNPVLAAHLARRFPRVEVVTGAAADLARMLWQRGVPGVDPILSGLPRQSLAGPIGARLVGTTAGCPLPGGVYTQFTYSWTRWAPPARRQRSALIGSFQGRAGITEHLAEPAARLGVHLHPAPGVRHPPGHLCGPNPSPKANPTSVAGADGAILSQPGPDTRPAGPVGCAGEPRAGRSPHTAVGRSRVNIDRGERSCRVGNAFKAPATVAAGSLSCVGSPADAPGAAFGSPWRPRSGYNQ